MDNEKFQLSRPKPSSGPNFEHFEFSRAYNIFFTGYFVYYLLTTEGSLKERLSLGITPVIQPRADAVIAMEQQKLAQTEDHVDLDVEMRLVDNPETNTDIVKPSSNNHC